MRTVCAGISAALVLVLGLAAPVAAEPITLLIGLFSFDEFIPRGESPGTNAFNIVNHTGSNAIFDPNAAVDLTFSDLVVTLTDALGQNEVVEIDDSLGSGPLLDPLTSAPLFILQRPDTALFASAMLAGTVDLGSFLLSDGRLFTPDSTAFTALLLPSAGSFLNPFDIVGIELVGDASTAHVVPEPSTLLLICSGLSLLCSSRHHWRNIRQ